MYVLYEELQLYLLYLKNYNFLYYLLIYYLRKFSFRDHILNRLPQLSKTF